MYMDNSNASIFGCDHHIVLCSEVGQSGARLMLYFKNLQSIIIYFN